jgi:hypothetical protein
MYALIIVPCAQVGIIIVDIIVVIIAITRWNNDRQIIRDIDSSVMLGPSMMDMMIMNAVIRMQVAFFSATESRGWIHKIIFSISTTRDGR